jgi:hypothetical protein
MSMEPAEHHFDEPRTRSKKRMTKGRKEGAFWKASLKAEGGGLPALEGPVMEWVEMLWNVWRRMRQDDRRHDIIYENRSIRIGGKLHLGVRALEMAGLDASELAVTTTIVDTFDARFSKRKTLPMFVVDDAEWDLKNQAEDFRLWLHGKLSEVQFEKVYGECVTDMLVRGDGVAYIDEGEDDVFCERVHRSELLVDPYEAKRGETAVRTIYRFRTISRDALLEMFPEHAKAIEACPAAPRRDEHYTSDWLASESQMGDRDVVDLIEAWHLPKEDCDPEEDGGGRKLVCIANATLCYEEWKSPRFPFARLTFRKPRRGYWGSGLVERLEPTQRQINRMVADIAQNVAVTGKGVWLVPEQADVPVEKLSGYRPFKLTYRGVRAPEFTHPTPINPTTLALLEKKIAWAHEMVGAAQWSVQGRSPLGAGASGVAIDTMEDLLSDRHSKQEEACSLFRLDASQCFLDAAGRVAARSEDEEYDEPVNDNDERDAENDEESDEPKKREPVKKTRKRGYYATWMDKGRLERLNWHEVAMTPDQYRLQLEPVNFLSQTRSGKLAQTAELIKTGVIEQKWAATLYEEPDLAHVNRIRLATDHNAERMVKVIGNRKKPMPVPEEWHDLDLLLELTKAYYNRAQNEIKETDPAYEEVLTRFREFGDLVIAAQDRIAKAEAEKAAAMAPPPMPGGPMPPDPNMPPPGPMPGAPIDPMAAPLPVAA